MKTLKAVFFDLDDTLYSTSEFAARARRASVDAMVAQGVRMTPEDLFRELEEVIAEFTSNYEHHFDKLLLRIPPSTWEGVNRAVLIAAAVVGYHETKSRDLAPWPDAMEFLGGLARTSLIRGIITSGLEIKQAEKLLRLRVLPFLSPGGLFISDQIGISKPNVKLYLRACEAMGVLPAEAMYVGDHPTHDIDPANEIGMTTVLVRRGGRHGRGEGKTAAAHEIRDFAELRRILSASHGIEIPPAV